MDIPDTVLEAARDALPWWVGWGGPLLWPAVVFVVALASSWSGQIIALRKFVRAADAHWTERARLLVPARGISIACLVVAPLVGIVTASFTVGPLYAVPGRVVFLAMFLLGIAGTLVGSYLVPVRAYDRAVPLREMLRTFVAYWLLLAPHVVVLITAASVMPFAWSVSVPVIVVVAMAVYTWLARGGVVLLLRPFGLITRDDDLRALVAERASAAGAPVPGAYLLETWPANAFALPSGNTLLISRALHGHLSREETGSIIDHELGHLSEPRRVVLQRLSAGWLVVVMSVAIPLAQSFGVLAGLAVPVVSLVCVLLVRKMPRRMEERADALAVQHQEDEGTYARALAKIYEFNLTPAVTGRKAAHPDLYDRMTAAGVEPGFPKPAPPAKRPPFLAVLAVVFCIAPLPVLFGIFHDTVVDRVWDEGEGHETALMLTGGQPWVLLDLGRRRRDAGDEASGLALVDLAAEMAAGDPDPLTHIARYHKASEDMDRARAVIERATELARGPHAGRPWLSISLADWWWRLGDTGRARDWYERALSEAEDSLIRDAYFRFEAGVVVRRLGDTEAALEHLEHATATAQAAAQDDPWLCVRLAFLNFDVGRLEQHEAWLARARATGADVEGYIKEMADDR